MVLADGSTDEVFSDLGHGDIRELVTRDYIKTAPVTLRGKEAQTALVSWELFQVFNQPIANAKPGSGRQRRFVQVRGIEEPAVSGLVHELALKEGGNWFDPAPACSPCRRRQRDITSRA